MRVFFADAALLDVVTQGLAHLKLPERAFIKTPPFVEGVLEVDDLDRHIFFIISACEHRPHSSTPQHPRGDLDTLSIATSQQHTIMRIIRRLII